MMSGSATVVGVASRERPRVRRRCGFRGWGTQLIGKGEAVFLEEPGEESSR